MRCNITFWSCNIIGSIISVMWLLLMTPLHYLGQDNWNKVHDLFGHVMTLAFVSHNMHSIINVITAFCRSRQFKWGTKCFSHVMLFFKTSSTINWHYPLQGRGSFQNTIQLSENKILEIVRLECTSHIQIKRKGVCHILVWTCIGPIVKGIMSYHAFSLEPTFRRE